MNKKISLTELESELYHLLEAIRSYPDPLTAADIPTRHLLHRLGRRMDQQYRSLSGHSFDKGNGQKSSYNWKTGTRTYKEI